MAEAAGLAEKGPDRFLAGTGNWVTTRFTAEKPLPKKVWSRWLKESCAGPTKGGGAAPRGKA